MREGTVRHLWFVRNARSTTPPPEGKGASGPESFAGRCDGCGHPREDVQWRAFAQSYLCEACYSVWYEIRFM